MNDESNTMNKCDQCGEVNPADTHTCAPVRVECKHQWFSTGAMAPGECRCIQCGTWGKLISNTVQVTREQLAELYPPPNIEVCCGKPETCNSPCVHRGVWLTAQPALPPAAPGHGCDFCNHQLYVGTKCKNCGRATLPAPVQESGREAFLAGYEAAQEDAKVCDLPAHGWRCTRTAGHDGPCAAVESPEDIELVANAMKRLREATPPAQQAPVQKTTDWVFLLEDRFGFGTLSQRDIAIAVEVERMVNFTHKPAAQPAVPLTDEQIWRLWWSRHDGLCGLEGVKLGEIPVTKAEFVAIVRSVLSYYGITKGGAA